MLYILLFSIEKQSSNVSNGSFKLDLDLHNSTVQISKPSSQKLKQNLGKIIILFC